MWKTFCNFFRSHFFSNLWLHFLLLCKIVLVCENVEIPFQGSLVTRLLQDRYLLSGLLPPLPFPLFFGSETIHPPTTRPNGIKALNHPLNHSTTSLFKPVYPTKLPLQCMYCWHSCLTGLVPSASLSTILLFFIMTDPQQITLSGQLTLLYLPSEFIGLTKAKPLGNITFLTHIITPLRSIFFDYLVVISMGTRGCIVAVAEDKLSLGKLSVGENVSAPILSFLHRHRFMVQCRWTCK